MRRNASNLSMENLNLEDDNEERLSESLDSSEEEKDEVNHSTIQDS